MTDEQRPKREPKPETRGRRWWWGYWGAMGGFIVCDVVHLTALWLSGGPGR